MTDWPADSTKVSSLKTYAQTQTGSDVSFISYYCNWLTDWQATGLHVQCNDTSNIQVHVMTLKVPSMYSVRDHTWMVWQTVANQCSLQRFKILLQIKASLQTLLVLITCPGCCRGPLMTACLSSLTFQWVTGCGYVSFKAKTYHKKTQRPIMINTQFW